MPEPQTPWEQEVTRAMRACTRVFGEGRDDGGVGAVRVLYQHVGGSVPAYRPDGIFEATTEVVDLETGAAVMSNQPRISFALADLQAMPAIGDTITIRGTPYSVIEPSFDGQGTVSLRLHVAPAPTEAHEET